MDVADAAHGSAADAEGPTDEASALPPLPVRVLDVLFSPGRLFAALAEEPRALGALVLGATMLVLSAVLIPAELYVESIRQAVLEQQGQLPDGFDPSTFGTLQKAIGTLFQTIFWFVMAAVAASISTVIFPFVLGDKGSWRQHMAIVAHAFLIMALGTLLTTPLRIFGGDLQLTLNLGLFLPFDDGWLARTLRYTDLFVLWTFTLMGLGAHALDPRRKPGTAITILLMVPLTIAGVIAAFTGS